MIAISLFCMCHVKKQVTNLQATSYLKRFKEWSDLKHKIEPNSIPKSQRHYAKIMTLSEPAPRLSQMPIGYGFV